MGFLDATGVTLLVNKLKNKFARISHTHTASDLELPEATQYSSGIVTLSNSVTYDSTSQAATANSLYRAYVKAMYGISSDVATSQVKSVTCSNYRLESGQFIAINFSNANTYTSNVLKLNINQQGQKNVYVNGEATSSTNTLLWDAGETILFAYYDSHYNYISKSKANVIVDNALSSTSENPVQNKVINTALSGKADSSHNHSASEITSGTISTNRLPSASTSGSGIVTLNSSTTNTSESYAATLKAVNQVWEKVMYGTSSASESSSVKAIICSNYSLVSPQLILIKFSNANQYTGGVLKFNINDQGEKSVSINNGLTSSTNTLIWYAGDKLLFMYDGSYYNFLAISRMPLCYIDSALSSTSINPVKNSVIYSALSGKQDTLTVMTEQEIADAVDAVWPALYTITTNSPEKAYDEFDSDNNIFGNQITEAREGDTVYVNAEATKATRYTLYVEDSATGTTITTGTFVKTISTQLGCVFSFVMPAANIHISISMSINPGV